MCQKSLPPSSLLLMSRVGFAFVDLDDVDVEFHETAIVNVTVEANVRY